MLKECLDIFSMRQGVPFIAPRQLGAVECIVGRQFLPSVDWRTGHCPVHHWTLSGADLFPYLAKLTVAVVEPLAHRTVRCSNVIVGSATRQARKPRPTVAPADCWLTGQSGDL
jgi:hypothetical protein